MFETAKVCWNHSQLPPSNEGCCQVSCQSIIVEMSSTLKKKHPEGCFFSHSDHRVELVGFEPTSKQGNHALSTCLVDHYFSTEGRGATPYLKLSH
jgi:hypothetical protein